VYIGGEEMQERNLAIKVDDELFKKIKIKLANDGKTLKEYLLELIHKDFEQNKK
jgi:predicted DNA binding CopG/RHH family protein